MSVDFIQITAGKFNICSEPFLSLKRRLWAGRDLTYTCTGPEQVKTNQPFYLRYDVGWVGSEEVPGLRLWMHCALICAPQGVQISPPSVRTSRVGM
jgi:hypothetical protein